MSMELKLGLAGKVVLVVGGGGINDEGIGPSTCCLLAEAGANVVVVDMDIARAEAVAKRVRSLGCKSVAIAANVLREQDIAAMTRAALDAFGGIDVMVTVIGGTPFTPALEMDKRAWEDVFSLNLTYFFLCTKAIAASMIQQNRPGKIISIATTNGITASAQMAPYGAAKAGLISLTKTLAVELAPNNIQVNSVAPGVIATPKLLALMNRNTGVKERVRRFIPRGRVGTPDEIAGAVLWLASDLASYVTGQTIVVDGGLLLNNMTAIGLTED